MLPQIVNNISHHPTPLLEFRGLNLNNTAQPGEFKDTLGLSSAGYPFLTQIPERTEIHDYTAPRDIFVWDRSVFVVDSTSLVKDGTTIGTVSAGKKQVAVINTKLVIFPDKKYVDLTTDQIYDLATSFSGDSVTYSSDDSGTVLSKTGIGANFNVGDTVDVSIGTTTYEHLSVLAVSADQITVTSFLQSGSGSIASTVTVATSIPDLDFICSSGNRIWGVSNADNTIYCSALGDPSDFFTYGSDTGAFSAVVGSDGDFSAICAYGGTILAWKENMLHKVLGSYPSEYYMIDTPTYGVQIGSEKSMVIINNVLYYKGVFGIYQFSGNSPILISSDLGLGIYTDGVATTDGRKYYIGMADADGAYHLYAYDLLHGFWMKEEDGQVEAMANLDRDVFYIVKSTTSDDIYPGRNLMLGTLLTSNTPHLPSIKGQLAASSVGTNNVVTVQSIDKNRIKIKAGSSLPSLQIGAQTYDGEVTMNGLDTGVSYVLSFDLVYFFDRTAFDGRNLIVEVNAHTRNGWAVAESFEKVLAKGNVVTTHVSVPFNISDNCDGAYITIATDGTTCDEDDYLVLGNMKLEINDETSWTPAPEDQAYVMYEVGKTLDNRHWSCEMAEVTEDYYGKTSNLIRRKGYTKLIFRLDMSAGSTLHIYAREDRRDYRLLWSQEYDRAVTMVVPIRLGRCDRWQLKMDGVGEVTIRGIERQYVLGGNR